MLSTYSVKHLANKRDQNLLSFQKNSGNVFVLCL